MTSKFMMALCSTAAVLTFVDTHAAFAQQAAQESASAGNGLEEIVVTARRKEERVQTVPLAITAFNQNQLDQNRVLTLTDLSRSVPSLAISVSQSDTVGPALPNPSARRRHRKSAAQAGKDRHLRTGLGATV